MSKYFSILHQERFLDNYNAIIFIIPDKYWRQIDVLTGNWPVNVSFDFDDEFWHFWHDFRLCAHVQRNLTKTQAFAPLITQPFHFNCQIVNKSLVQRCLKEPSFYICSTLRVRSIWLEFRNNLVQRYLIGCVFLTCESKVPHSLSADFISNFRGFLWLQSTQLSGRTIFEYSRHFSKRSNIYIIYWKNHEI